MAGELGCIKAHPFSHSASRGFEGISASFSRIIILVPQYFYVNVGENLKSFINVRDLSLTSPLILCLGGMVRGREIITVGKEKNSSLSTLLPFLDSLILPSPR